MKPVANNRNAWLSVAILSVGVVAYWVICQPAIGRRGYPEIDPFYLGLRWLWLCPIVLSAWFDGSSWHRRWSILVYVLATAFPAAGASDSFAVPRMVDMQDMLTLGILPFFPFNLAVAAGLEWFTQRVLKLFRTFANGQEPRGAETRACTTRRTAVFTVVVLAGAVAFPFLYRLCVLANARMDGRRAAEWAWEHGRGVLYVDTGEYANVVKRDESGIPTYEIRESDRGLWEAVQSGWDPETGLRVEEKHGGIARRTYCDAYRSVIEDNLATYGPTSTARYLFTAEEVRALLGSGKLQKVTSFPLTHGKASIYEDGDVHSGNVCSDLGIDPLFVYASLVPGKGGVLVVASAQRVVTFDPEGKLLQFFDDHLLELEITEEVLQRTE